MENLKMRILKFLDFAPKAIYYSRLVKKFVKGSITEEVLEKVLQELISEGKIDQINSWFWKIKKIERELTKDDMEWLSGTGYYAQ
jgi:hypothetical protein